MALPTRLVICVDGTQSVPLGSKQGVSQTSIHRIFLATRRGKCLDSTCGTTFNQEVQYFPGIGNAEDAFSKDRLQASVLGQGHLKQIEDVYESCCRLTSPNDEVWFFGFSRGAYVVRAVAGLLHNYGAVASAGQPEFAKDWKKLLKQAEATQGRSSLALSPITSTTSGAARAPPRIQFVGAFDTIKAVNEHSLFDTSFNRSIHHMRHALALHEERKALTPEYIFPESLYGTPLFTQGRSFIEAHFIGNHTDMGGSSKKSGLGLYPLQWILLEANKCGLQVDIHSKSKDGAGLHDALAVVFPASKKSKRHDEATWSCTTENGIEVKMQDLRGVHGVVENNENYGVKLNTRIGTIRQKKPREPFTADGRLRGYCDWAPQGTIIHPSVYLLMDEHVTVALETKEIKLQRLLEDWREIMLGSRHGTLNTGFWLDEDSDDALNPGAIRILVCGNTGVGKSTLINKTFGVDVTQSSNRTRGIHNVRQEITFEGRPDLIVHDSGGFEAGADDEFQAIEAFLKEKSAAVDIKDRLHVIWFCVDINSARTLQTATEKLFTAVSQYANDVPIIVVATKKDDFLDIEFGAYRKRLRKEGKRLDEEVCEQHAEEKLKERTETIRNEMESVEGGRLDACVAVSQDDDTSIAHLSKTTSHCFDADKVRLFFIRAQSCQIDLKIDLALCEVMRRYKRLIRSSTGSAFAVGGATINQKVTTAAVTRAVINCFGLPSVSADTALEALKANVWSQLGNNAMLAMAETLQLIGLTGTIFAAGIPAWLVTGAINSSYIVPATCRLFLIMAMDLTFVLARSFKEITFRATGQPNERDVSAAARNYAIRGYSQHVHRDIKKLVPRRNVIASFKADAVQQGLDALLAMYKDNLMDDVDLPLKVKGMRIESGLLSDDTSTEASIEADSTLFADAKEAREQLAELEAKEPLVAEMDGNKPLVELPAESSKVVGSSSVAELEDVSSRKKRYELQG